MPAATTDANLTYTDVAEQLGVGVRMIRRYVLEKGLPVVRLGHRTVRVRQSDLDAWVAARLDRGNTSRGAA